MRVPNSAWALLVLAACGEAPAPAVAPPASPAVAQEAEPAQRRTAGVPPALEPAEVEELTRRAIALSGDDEAAAEDARRFLERWTAERPDALAHALAGWLPQSVAADWDLDQVAAARGRAARTYLPDLGRAALRELLAIGDAAAPQVRAAVLQILSPVQGDGCWWAGYPETAAVANWVLDRISDPDADVRSEVVQALLGSGPALAPHVDRLRSALESDDEDLRNLSLNILEYSGASPAPLTGVLARLAFLAEDEERGWGPMSARSRAAEFLLDVDPAASVPELLSRLASEDLAVRRRAVELAANLVAADPRLLAPFADAMNDPDPGLRARATCALALLDPPPPGVLESAFAARVAAEVLYALPDDESESGPIEIWWELLARQPAVWPFVTAQLDSPSASARATAAATFWSWREVTDPGISPPLGTFRRLLGDPSGDVREAALVAFESCSTSRDEVARVAIEMLRDPDEDVRSAALSLLHEYATSRDGVVQAAVTLLHDPDEFVRLEAARILAAEPDLPDEALRALREAVRDPEILRRTARALVARRRLLDLSLPVLVEGLRTFKASDGYDVRQSLDSIAECGPPAIAAEAAVRRWLPVEGCSAEAIAALRSIGAEPPESFEAWLAGLAYLDDESADALMANEPAGPQILLEYLAHGSFPGQDESSHFWGQDAAGAALVRSGETGLELLTGAASSPDAALRDTAARWLPLASPRIAHERLFLLRRDPDASVRAAAMCGICLLWERAPSTELAGWMADGLEDGAVEVRREAARALAAAGDAVRPFLPAFRTLLSDPDLDVRGLAAVVVWEQTGEVETTAPALDLGLRAGPGRDIRMQLVRARAQIGDRWPGVGESLGAVLPDVWDQDELVELLGLLASFGPSSAPAIPGVCEYLDIPAYDLHEEAQIPCFQNPLFHPLKVESVEGALDVVIAVGPGAAAALPKVRRLLGDPRVAARARRALAAITGTGDPGR